MQNTMPSEHYMHTTQALSTADFDVCSKDSWEQVPRDRDAPVFSTDQGEGTDFGKPLPHCHEVGLSPLGPIG